MNTKEKILRDLRNNDFVSGEKLAHFCGISRNAVHKNVETLRSLGFVIEAVTNKGYHLVSEVDFLEEQKIASIIQNKNLKILTFKTVDSTLTEAKRQIASINNFRDSAGNLTEKAKEFVPMLIASESQTSGHGRMGRVFASPKNSGIYFTLIYAPKGGVKNPSILTVVASVAVCRVIKNLYGIECQIKWVNDIFLFGKKICGILTEGVANFETGTIPCAMVGIGINIRNSNFDEELSKVASSIEDLLNEKKIPFQNVNKNEIVAEITKELLSIYDEYFENQNENLIHNIIEEYKSRSILIGKTVKVNPVAGLNGKSYFAKVLDIDEQARLVVQNENKEILALSAGEVSLKSENFSS